MEREGLVRRERSKTDRRVVHIRLSEKGAKLARQIEVEPMEVFRGALLSLSAAELKDMLRIMNKLGKHVRSRLSTESATESGDEAT
jgi:DNA-binding MarR family transcriptional regulator